MKAYCMTMSYKHCRYIQRRSVLKNDNIKYVKFCVLSKLNDNKYQQYKCIQMYSNEHYSDIMCSFYCLMK